VVLREHDVAGATNIGLIGQLVRYALDHEYDVVLEGILHAGRYSDMLRALRNDHVGKTLHYYFDVSFDETTRRHATRPQASEFGVDAMLEWYRPGDYLPFVAETIIPQTWSIDETTKRILADAGFERTDDAS
jgi:hypothetical protein